MTILVRLVTITAACAILTIGSARAQSDAWLKLERIDVQANGSGTATRYAVANPAISDDGRWIVFASTATDLIADDTNARSDIFLRDRRTQTTRRISVRSDGTQTSADSWSPSIASNGRFITFVSGEKLIVANDGNFEPDQFLLDRDADGNGLFDEVGGTSIELISLNNSNATFFNGAKDVVTGLDETGSSVAFVTLQPLVGNDTNSANDVYVRSRSAAASRLLSESTSMIVGNGSSPDFFSPPVRMSDNGSLVAFSSDATNLDLDRPGSGLFVRNRDSDGNGIFDEVGGVTTTRIIITAPGGGTASSGPFQQFDLSRDGHWLVVAASDPQGINPSGTDIFLRDLVLNTDKVIPFVAADWAKGGTSCCGNQTPRVSRMAQVTAFSSTQLYAFGGVTTGRSDVFVQVSNRPLNRITNFTVPTDVDDGYSFGAAAMSANGIYLIVGVAKAGAVGGPDEGYFVYQRDDVFNADFDLQP
jgi:hypothetical protein